MLGAGCETVAPLARAALARGGVHTGEVVPGVNTEPEGEQFYVDTEK